MTQVIKPINKPERPKPEPTGTDGLPLRYGPFQNACSYCGASLLTGMKPQHIQWHEKNGDPAPPIAGTTPAEDTQQ